MRLLRIRTLAMLASSFKALGLCPLFLGPLQVDEAPGRASAAQDLWTFTRPVTAGQAIGDLNGDGLGDLLLFDRSITGHVYVFLGAPASEGGPSERPHRILTPPDDLAPSGPSTFVPAMTSGDLDRDGYDDLVLSFTSHSVSFGTGLAIYHGSPGGLPAEPTLLLESPFEQFPAEGGHLDLEAGSDLDGDGFDDLVVGGSTVLVGESLTLFIYPGRPWGIDLQPTMTHASEVPGLTRGLVTGVDVDGDGLGDVVQLQGEALLVFPGRRAELPATTPLRSDIPLAARDLFALGDVDGDRLDDLTFNWLAAFPPPTDRRCFLLPGRVGGPRFFGRVRLRQIDGILGVGDVDGDGHLDWAGRRGDQARVILGDGTLRPSQVIDLGPASDTTRGPFTVGDLDGDGTSELLLLRADGTAVIQHWSTSARRP